MPDPLYSTRYTDGKPCYIGDPITPSVVTGVETVDIIPFWCALVIIALLVVTYHLGYKVGQYHPSKTTCAVEALK